MKFVEKKKPVRTIPKGVWESSRPVQKQEPSGQAADLQGNGYPEQAQDRYAAEPLPEASRPRRDGPGGD